ncbi:TonB-dependent receptor plug domain-containing protein [Aurantiacibacter sp. MUD11]|uniref:TonB-dependent receptor plug domain-containing protein n=1 Tax=Aurantiacibacter sp. MUD11 TaxID=3003265 RepID=UPI0022AA1D3E|nr:TonB-dependent receptor plug domain-containing protein [Aurantiacibacter sp. MUD11]WAT18845.1 TonB-dependent receptor plug domain-containing protein [Aurantiacibacter sp. MUD11]
MEPAPSAATAQENDGPATGPAPEVEEDDVNTILVLGARLVGQVDAPEPPILELDEADIAAYGAGSIAELLQALGPQVNSSRGRGGSGGFGGGGGPVILVNGVRISSFRELRSYPPEAIERTEVFSEDVAQRYGYSPDQRVVNFILKDNFSSREIEVEYGQPFDGGYSTQEVEGTYLRIDGPSRLNLNLEWDNSSMLTEAERDIVQADGSLPDLATDPDPAEYRSLVADSAGVEATVNWSTRLGQAGNSLSLNATYEREDSLRLQGLDIVLLTDDQNNTLRRTFNEEDPLTVDRRSETYAMGSTVNLQLGEWEVTGTLDGTYVDSISRTGRRVDTTALVADAAAGLIAIDGDLGTFAEAGVDESLTDTYTFNALSTARATPIFLPAGDISVTLDAGYRWNRIESSDTRALAADIGLSRSRVFGGANVAIPLTSRDEEVVGAVGDITLNLNVGVDYLSDFGTLTDWTAGVTWGVTDTITFTANHINREVAPSLSQLGNPAIATPNVPVFDILNNETVLATVITGGNPNLPAQDQSDWKFGVIWELPFIDGGSVSVDYYDNHSTNVTASLPVLTPEIEAAFPDRVTRDATGQLIQVDERFITFAERDERRLQFGLNLSGRIGGESEGRGGRGGPPGGAAGGPPPGAFGGGQGGATGQGGPPNAERFQAMRATFCETEPDQLADLFNRAIAAQAAGEEPPVGPDGQPIAIPPQMLERLTGENGQVDPERFAAIRERICSADGPPQFAGQGGPQGGPPGGPPQAGQGGPPAGGGRGRGGFRGGFGPFGGSGGPPSGRWFLNLNYTLELENTVLIAPGLPRLDLLDGDALTGGGEPRHAASARAGVFYDGFGLISFANYTGSSRIEGSSQPGSTDLYFDDIVTFNLRAFADLGRRQGLVEQVPFFENTRIGIGIDNLFDARQRVTDSNGDTPQRYQPLLLDPVGRSFEIEIRKLF